MRKVQQQLKKNWYFSVLGILLLVAICIRFYQLGSIPHGMTWDEAAIGYNGFSIWHTHRDEWLRLMPISFQSFGDYKAPAAIYISGFFTWIFGLNLFAVRIPFTVSSIFVIVSTSFLSWVLYKLANQDKALAASVITTALFVFSPWHIHFSRAGFESGMSLAFCTVGIAILLGLIFKNKQRIVFKNRLILLNNNYFLLAFSSAFLVASMYTYHSAKIVTPLLALLVVGVFKDHWLKNSKQLVFIAIASILFLLPMVLDSIYGPGAARLSQTSIVSVQGSSIEKTGLLISNYIAHFSPSFLVLGQTPNLRHGAGAWGVVLPTTLVFIVAAIGLGLYRYKKNILNNKAFLFYFFWILIGILPAALGADEVPHSNRALLALPGFLGLASIGVLSLVKAVENASLNKKLRGNHGEKNTIRDAVIGTIVLLHGIFFFSFWNYYLNDFAKNSSTAYQDGYLEAFEIATDYERGENGKPAVEKIIFSDEYGQPYIYAIFSRKTSPIYYRGGSLIKYEFKNTDIGDFQRSNTLVVASQQDSDFPIERADHVVFGQNGEVRFHMYYLP